MSLTIEIVCAAVATLVLFGAPALLLARVGGLGPVARPLAGMTMRLFSVALLAAGVAIAATDDRRVALLLAIAATYFAAALADGVWRFRNRGAVACTAR